MFLSWTGGQFELDLRARHRVFAGLGYDSANLANIVYHWRFARERFSVLLNLAIPLIGLAAQLFVVWQLVVVEMWKQNTFGRTGQAFILLGTLATVLYVARARKRSRTLTPNPS